MTFIQRLRSAAAVASASCLTVAPAVSTAADSFSEQRWEEVVVIGNHLPRPAREVGSAVTVLTEQDIHNRRVNLGSELLREVPGTAVNRGGGAGNLTQVRIRGAEGNHTLVLIDGIEANDPALSSEFNFGDFMTYDVDRIEVLRGPQSALYGSDAIGGVISITTAEPRDGLNVHGEVEGGSFGTSQFGASISGGSERVSALLSANHYHTDGISTSAIHPEEDGYETATVHGKLTAELTPALTARLVVRRSDSEIETDIQDFSFPATATQGLLIDADDRTDATQRYGLAELEGALWDGRWLHRAAFGYTDTETDNFSDGTWTNGSDGERRKFEYETTLRAGRGDFEHALTAGIQHEELEFSNRSATTPSANQDQDDEQTSYVAEYALTFNRNASISLSVRRDDNQRFQDATTTRATGSYLFEHSGTRLHASYGEGITNPNFFELFGYIPDSFQGNPALKPERSESWDIGVEQSLFNGRALVDVTYFDATLDEEIATVFDSVTFQSTVVNQSGESNREGVEVTLQARLNPQWSLHGAYTYLDATEPDGVEELRRPEHTASLNVNYAFLDGRANVNLSAIYNGEQQDSEFVPTTAATRVTLDDYTLVNLAATYQVSDAVQVFARGENLLDEDYTETFSYRSPGAAGYLGVRVRL